MISNPKVGQRVVAKDMYGDWRIATVVEVSDRIARVEDGGWQSWQAFVALMDPAALRAEAQRLMDAADKLESEAMPNPEDVRRALEAIDEARREYRRGDETYNGFVYRAALQLSHLEAAARAWLAEQDSTGEASE